MCKTVRVQERTHGDARRKSGVGRVALHQNRGIIFPVTHAVTGALFVFRSADEDSQFSLWAKRPLGTASAACVTTSARYPKGRFAMTFYEGDPCRTCGSTKRYVKGAGCVKCRRESRRRWRHNNREKALEATREWKRNNRDHINEYNKKNRHKYADKAAEYRRLWRSRNKKRRQKTDAAWRERNREGLRDYHRQWRERNRKHLRSYSRKYYRKNLERCRQHSREYYKNNKEKAKRASRRWAQRNKDRVNRRAQRWRSNNPERSREAGRRWYRNNRDKALAISKTWKRQNRKKNAAYEAARRARKKSAPGNGVTGKQWEDILKHYGNQCLRCGTEDNITMDHVVPLVAGGAHDPSNIQPLCLSCNSSKSDKVVDYRKRPLPERWIQEGLFDD